MDITPSEAAVLRQVIEDGGHDAVGPSWSSSPTPATWLAPTATAASDGGAPPPTCRKKQPRAWFSPPRDQHLRGRPAQRALRR